VNLDDNTFFYQAGIEFAYRDSTSILQISLCSLLESSFSKAPIVKLETPIARTLPVDISFSMGFDFDVEKEEPVKRIRRRGTLYMKESMVESQLAIKEQPSAWETDLLPVDAGKSVEEIVEEAIALLAVAKEIL
jgi:hypothetical protein